MSAKLRYGFIGLAMLVAGFGLSACGSAATPTTTTLPATTTTLPAPSQKIADFNTFVATFKKHLSDCASATHDALSGVDDVIKQGSNVSQTEMTALDSVAVIAQATCGAKNSDLVALNKLVLPGTLSALTGLAETPAAAVTWASKDCVAFLKVVQNIAELSGTQVGNDTHLLAAQSKANTDSAAIVATFNMAATTLKTKSPSLGFVTFPN